jgi:hypothetical protein
VCVTANQAFQDLLAKFNYAQQIAITMENVLKENANAM